MHSEPRGAPGQSLVEGVGRFDNPHTSSAPSHRRLDDHRIAQGVGHGMRTWPGLHGRVAAGENRHAGLPGQGSRRNLVAQEIEQLRPGADEDDSGRLASPREVRVLGQESVSRMDRVNLLLLRQRRRSPRY